MLIKILKLINTHKTIVKFIIAGGTAAMTDIALLFFCTDILGIWYLVSAVLAFIFAFFVSFFLQKYWTFRDQVRDKMYKQMGTYLAITGLNLCINTGGMYVLVDIVGIMYLLSQIILGASLAFVSFIVYQRYVFKKSNRPVSSENGKRRILIATGIFPPDIGGPATYSEALLKELPKHGFEVKVVTYGQDAREYKNIKTLKQADKNVFVVDRDRNLWARYFWYFWKVQGLAEWADVIYVMGPVSEGLPACLASIVRGKDYILKVVGDYAWEQGSQRYGVTDPIEEFQKNAYSRPVERMRRIQKFVAGHAAAIITPSEFLKTIVEQWGINSDKIGVIYNAVKFETADPVAGKPSDETWILSVGRLTRWKGMETLIEIMPDLVAKDRNVKLKIIGDGPEYNKLREQINGSEVRHNIELLGRLDHKQTLAHINSSDLFVLNSAYEGLSHVLLEAMSYGKPVLASSSGGNGEIVLPGKTGDLFRYNDVEGIKAKIIRFLDTKDGRNALSYQPDQSGFFDRFSFGTMINRTVDILERHA